MKTKIRADNHGGAWDLLPHAAQLCLSHFGWANRAHATVLEFLCD